MQSIDSAKIKTPREIAAGVKRVVTVKPKTGDISPYVDALSALGIQTVFGASLAGAAGLMLMGGTDVNPTRYDEERQSETGAPDHQRDSQEIALIAEALRIDLPILAICRGMQILNVQHGGTLIQHLDSVKRHRQRSKDQSLNAHEIQIAGGTKLARMAGPGLSHNVNSRHHQAVGRVGEGLVVSAIDPEDRVIEAIERPDRRFVIGVQWHPENQISMSNLARCLFQAFAAALESALDRPPKIGSGL
jgi:putative glutamine amidotransferase